MKMKMIDRIYRRNMKSKSKFSLFYIQFITNLVQYFLSYIFHFNENIWILDLQTIIIVLLSYHEQMLYRRCLIYICYHIMILILVMIGLNRLKLFCTKDALRGIYLNIGIQDPSLYSSKHPDNQNLVINILMMQKESIQIKEEIKITQQPSSQIIITVDQPSKNQSQTLTFFTYSINGRDANGAYSIRRRYRDFDLLRRKLAQRWSGIYIPPISGKRSEANFLQIFKKLESDHEKAQIKYVETRTRFLRYFCKGIAARPYLYYCDLFQLFLRASGDYDAIISGVLQKEIIFVLGEYENNFKMIVELTTGIQFSTSVALNQSHYGQLKQCQDRLLTIYEQAANAAQAREQFNNQFNICMGKVLPQYENQFFFHHVEKQRTKLIIEKDQKFGLKLKEYSQITALNPLDLFLELVGYQIRETKAFIEAIEGRRQAESRKNEIKQKIESKKRELNNLKSGGFSLKSMFKSGSKQLQSQQIEMKIQILTNQVVCMQKMIVMMVINTNYEIQQYKLRRSEQYKEVFKKAAGKELIQLEAYKQLMNGPLSAF